MPDNETHPAVEVLDLAFGEPGVIAAFVIRTADGPVLVETGPESTYTALARGLQSLGEAPEAVRHVLLTHIHLDHAGAAWRLAEHGATVYVHPVGAPHLADPSRLLASASKIYGDKMDALWGRLEPVPADRLRTVGDREILRIGGVSIEALHTPGHANHHIAYRLDGAMFTGDVGGVRVGSGPVVPPCPPPDIDLEAWRSSLAAIESERPELLYLTHFGAFRDVASHLDRLERALASFAEWVKARLDEGAEPEVMVPQFEAYTGGFLDAHGCVGHERERYALANPAFMSVAGLVRYWRKTAQRAAPATAGRG
jgi:glyoxylase-like metal-dependent hydrolase (beta-lactamase superfamily II)